MSWFSKPLRLAPSLQVLAGSALLTGLTSSELRIVHGFLHERQYLPGEVIFDQGEEGQALYFLLRGRVAICHHGHADSPIAELGDGNFFGEMGLLDNWPRSAQAIAVEETHLAVLFRGDFERLMESHARIASRIALQLARFLGQRLRRMVAQQQAEIEEA